MSDQEETKTKVNVKVALSWGIPWFAGMLFTIGFVPYSADLGLWQQLGQWFFTLLPGR